MAGDDLQSKAADLVRKVLTVGVGAIFLTEESVRGLVSEFKLPKELIGGVLESAGKTKDDFLQKLSSEILATIKNRVDPKALVDEMLTKYDIDFHIKMRFKPKPGGDSSPSTKQDDV